MINLTEAADDLNDEALIRAIRRMNDPEQDGKRHDSCSDDDGDDEEEMIKMPKAPIDRDMERIQNDTALRHHLKLGSSFTGPKGVKADYKFHQQQERARMAERNERDYEKVSAAALSSGWLQRTLAEEDDKDDDKNFLNSYRQKRIAEMSRMANSNRFGSVLELQPETFVWSIDNEAKDVKILIHLYDSDNQASRLVDAFFSSLAPKYASTKFCRIAALKADPDFDLIGLPAILVYQGGSLEISLIRMIDEIPGWANSNRCTRQDFEQYLILQDVLDESQAMRAEDGFSEDDDDFSD